MRLFLIFKVVVSCKNVKNQGLDENFLYRCIWRDCCEIWGCGSEAGRSEKMGMKRVEKFFYV